MGAIPLSQLIPVLQVAIGPVILISGVGLLLLTLTNRLGRAVDRSRQLGGDMRKADEGEKLRLAGQVEIIYLRAQVLRVSIIMAAISVLLASLLIIMLFLTVLTKLEEGLVLILLFICCMISLIVSIGAFIRDVQLSLHALKLELEE